MFKSGDYDEIKDYKELTEAFKQYDDPNLVDPYVVQQEKGNKVVIYMNPTVLFPTEEDINGLD